MDDPVSSARQARENLAKGLAALQTPGVPSSLLNVAEPVALAMRALHSIETTRAASLTLEAPVALDQVRRGLAMLQELPSHHSAVHEATVAVAGSLSLVHGLVRRALPAQSQPEVQAAKLPSQVIEIAAPPRVAPAPLAETRPSAVHEIRAGSAVPPTQLSARGPVGFDQTVRYASPEPREYPLAARDERRGRPEVPPLPSGGPSGPRDRSYARTTPSAGNAPLDAAAPAPRPVTGAVLAAPSPVAARASAVVNVAAPAAVAPGVADARREAAEPEPAPPRAARAQRKTVPEARQPASGATDFSAELGAHSPTNFYKGLSGNDVIESGGIFVATYRVPSIGAPVAIKVTLPGGYEFQAVGVVQWTRAASEVGPESPPGFGARLTGLSAEGRQLIYRYVRNREPFFHDDL